MNNLELLKALDVHVAGHTEFKKALIALVTRSKLRHFQKYCKGVEKSNLLKTMKILVKGSSGTGKTHTVECLKSIVDFPFLRFDATQITPSGASGKSKPEDIEQAMHAEASRCFKENPTKYLTVEGALDRMVVFIDEFDKLVNSFESSGKWNKQVQSNLLTLLDNKHEFAGVSWILAGAFVDLDKNREIKNRSIGFGTHTEDLKQDALLDEELVKAGLIPEIVGRISYIVELDKFSKDDFISILNTRILPQKYLDLAAYGAEEQKLTKKQIELIAHNGMRSGQGVRYLAREVEKLFLDAEFEAGLSYSLYNEH